jgi:hypothetical protein
MIPTHPRSMFMNLYFTLKPMELVERADGLMDDAEALFKAHQSVMRRKDLILAQSWMLR